MPGSKTERTHSDDFARTATVTQPQRAWDLVEIESQKSAGELSILGVA